MIFKPSDLLSFSSLHFSLAFHSVQLLSLPFYSLSLSRSLFFSTSLSFSSKFSCSIWVAVEIKGVLFNSWIERNKWRQIRRVKGKVKNKDYGNWSRAKYLVLHYCLYSLLFLNFPCFLYPAPFSSVIWASRRIHLIAVWKSITYSILFSPLLSCHDVFFWSGNSLNLFLFGRPIYTLKTTHPLFS